MVIRCKAIKQFDLEKFDELKNIKRKKIEKKGTIFKDDIFECSEEMARYLLGNNQYGIIAVKVNEIIP